jgi:hypothetical protein
MIKSLILSLIFINFSYSSERNLIKDIPKIKDGPNIIYQDSCVNCGKLQNEVNETTILNSPSNHQVVELSLLSIDKVQALFLKLEANKEIPFSYGKDGCFARAHKMAMVIDEDQVISGKAFIQGRFYVQTINGPAFWTYHVAPVVMVKDGDRAIPYILDPSIFHKAVPLSEWKAGLSKSRKSVFLEEYFTNRFSYGLEDKDKTYNNYSDASITDMNIQNKKNLEILSRK